MQLFRKLKAIKNKNLSNSPETQGSSSEEETTDEDESGFRQEEVIDDSEQAGLIDA